MDKESRWYLLGVEARRAGRAHGDNPLPLPAAAFFVASEPRSGECRWMHGGGAGRPRTKGASVHPGPKTAGQKA
jgi:hypothetical protein